MASLEERYELLEVWGRGAHGTVWKARVRSSGRIVAVKRVPRDPRERAEAWEERLRREAELLARVRAPGIVGVVEVGFGLDEAWLVTDFVDGGSLEDLLKVRGRLAPLEAASLVAQAARALHAAHRAGVVHRDVKPGNLLLAADGTCRVTDFGVAGVPGERAPAGEAPGTFVGTPAYTAPEQLLGEPVDARADVWSLGVVLWRCLARETPFDGVSVAEVTRRVCHDPLPDPRIALPGVPAGVVDVLRRALARDPEERPATALEFARALEAAIVEAGSVDEPAGPLAGRSGDADLRDRVPTVGPAGRRPPSGWRGVVLAAAAAAAVFLAAWLALPRVVVPRAGAGAAARGRVARRALVAACRRTRDAACATALAAALAEDAGEDGVFEALGGGLRSGGPGPDPGARCVAGPDRVVPRAPAPGQDRRRERRRKPARRRGSVRRPVSPPAGEPAPAAPRPRPAGRRTAEAERASPVPAVATGREGDESAPPRGRGVVEVRHPFGEALVELLVDGRRAGLVRVGPGTPFPPGTPVTVSFSVRPGTHRLVLRVLSATARVDLEQDWTARWEADGFVATRWAAVSRGGRWMLARLP